MVMIDTSHVLMGSNVEHAKDSTLNIRTALFSCANTKSITTCMVTGEQSHNESDISC